MEGCQGAQGREEKTGPRGDSHILPQPLLHPPSPPPRNYTPTATQISLFVDKLHLASPVADVLRLKSQLPISPSKIHTAGVRERKGCKCDRLHYRCLLQTVTHNCGLLRDKPCLGTPCSLFGNKDRSDGG